MTPHALGLLIGGLLPAVLFSISNLSTKAATSAGINIGWFVLIVGLGVSLVGAAFLTMLPGRSLSLPAGLLSVATGMAWGLGMGCVMIALSRYGASLGVLTPLFNMNTLITVLLALWIFAEWKQVRIPQLLIGSVLIVAGGVMVARA